MISLMHWRKDDADEFQSSRTCSFSGWLWKMKRGRKVIIPQWNKRWFSIEGPFFRWYEQPSSEEMSGSMDLNMLDAIKTVETTQGAFTFILSHPDRKLLLRATSQNERAKWIRAIQAQADLAKGGSGDGIIGDKKIPTGSPNQFKIKRRSIKGRSLEQDLDRTMKQLDELEKQLQQVKREPSNSQIASSCQTTRRSSKPKVPLVDSDQDRAPRSQSSQASSRDSSRESQFRGSHPVDEQKRRDNPNDRDVSAKLHGVGRSILVRNDSINQISISKIIIEDDPDLLIDELEDIVPEPQRLLRKVSSTRQGVGRNSSSLNPNRTNESESDNDLLPMDAGHRSISPIRRNAKKNITAASDESDDFDAAEEAIAIRKPNQRLHQHQQQQDHNQAHNSDLLRQSSLSQASVESKGDVGGRDSAGWSRKSFESRSGLGSGDHDNDSRDRDGLRRGDKERDRDVDTRRSEGRGTGGSRDQERDEGRQRTKSSGSSSGVASTTKRSFRRPDNDGGSDSEENSGRRSGRSGTTSLSSTSHSHGEWEEAGPRGARKASGSAHGAGSQGSSSRGSGGGTGGGGY